jgi:Xaa-Pro aminopeptidase
MESANIELNHLLKEWLLPMVKKIMVLLIRLEPGYYKEGAFGIRIENILIVQPHGDGSFLGFKNVTMVPYERKLINTKLCTPKHIEHINAYHATVIN